MNKSGIHRISGNHFSKWFLFLKQRRSIMIKDITEPV